MIEKLKELLGKITSIKKETVITIGMTVAGVVSGAIVALLIDKASGDDSMDDESTEDSGSEQDGALAA